eukprot:358511-Chlamydomonas_euryale.AAC.1
MRLSTSKSKSGGANGSAEPTMSLMFISYLSPGATCRTADTPARPPPAAGPPPSASAPPPTMAASPASALRRAPPAAVVRGRITCCSTARTAAGALASFSAASSTTTCAIAAGSRAPVRRAKSRSCGVAADTDSSDCSAARRSTIALAAAASLGRVTPSDRSTRASRSATLPR